VFRIFKVLKKITENLMDICCVFNFIIFVSMGHYDLIGRPWRQKDLAQPQNPKHTHFVVLRLSLIVLRTKTK
jgi:hypothetical protein